MATKRPQTVAKREREMAVKEKRDRKRTRKAEAAALREAGLSPEVVVDADVVDTGDETS
jgi:hypothetical protein